MIAITVIANIVLFIGLFVGAFMALAWTAMKAIGYFNGARFAVLTQGDIAARKRFRWLTAGVTLAFAALSLVLYRVLGDATWSTFVLAPTIGAALGLAASYKMNFHRLKPIGWK